ncbi:MAG: ABC transporter substrate-binding protein [Limnohabitans sp.]
MDMQRRQMLFGALGTGNVLGPLSVLAASGLQPVTVALTARHSLYHLPLVLAERLGYFRQHGLQLNLVPHESGAAGAAAVLQGKADVLAGAFEHLFELQHKGHYFQAFVQMNNTPMVSLGVAARHATPRSWQMLKGTRIGVSALESCTHWMSSLWLMRNGLQPQDVYFVEVGTSASALGALWEGQVDALCNPDPVMHWLEQRGEIRLIAEARTSSGVQQVAGGALPGGCLMAREEFLLRHPQVAVALADGVVQALRWLQTAGPMDLFKTVPVAPWLVDPAVYLGAIYKSRDAYARDGQIQEDAVFNAWRLHARVATHVPVSRQGLARTFTNAFVQRVPARRAGTPYAASAPAVA